MVHYVKHVDKSYFPILLIIKKKKNTCRCKLTPIDNERSTSILYANLKSVNHQICDGMIEINVKVDYSSVMLLKLSLSIITGIQKLTIRIILLLVDKFISLCLNIS